MIMIKILFGFFSKLNVGLLSIHKKNVLSIVSLFVGIK